jgi:mannose-6-phosphate isomerase-like protein (cupin superfamily)
LAVTNLVAEAAASASRYRNIAVSRVNDACLRLATFEGVYPWHVHPDSDELFVVMDGTLEIDLADGRTLRLGPWDTVTIPAGVVHRTRAVGRTSNLCFERLETTTFLDLPEPGDDGASS